jgi:hypothetical protein
MPGSIDEKYAVEHEETSPQILDSGKDDIDRHLEVKVPESLQDLSAEEIAEIDRNTTRKLDILMMPTLVVLYVLNYLDRQNISSAKLANIVPDLHMTALDYSTAVAVLFAGYVSLQVPSNMLASKIPYPGICEFDAAR